MNDLINKLQAAANIRRMGTDTISGLVKIDKDVEKRFHQVTAGLVSESEAVLLIKRG
jgi:hypothetical protein